MKKICLFFVLLLIGSTSIISNAAEIRSTDDGVYTYRIIDDKYVELVSCISPEKADIESDGSYKIPSGVDGFVVKYLGEKLFRNTDVPANEIIIPDTVTHIGESVFDVMMTNPDRNSEEELIIGSRKLRSIHIPNSVVSIGDSAFENCQFLQEIEIPESVVYIGSDAFAGTGLKNVEIGRNVSYMGSGAFMCCFNLTEINVNASIKSINASTFADCPKLKKAVIPENIRSIGNKAFYGTALKSLTLKDSVKLGNNVFKSNPENKFKLKIICTGNNIGTFSKYSTAGADVNYIANDNQEMFGTVSCGHSFLYKLDGATGWKSSSPLVAKVSKNGKVVSLSKGYSEITAKMKNGKAFTLSLIVSKNPEFTVYGKKIKSISVKKDSVTTISIKGKAPSINNVYKNTSIAKILSKSNTDIIKIKGLKKGNTTLKIRINGKWMRLKVKVV